MGRMKDLYIESKEKQIEDDRDLDMDYDPYTQQVLHSEMPAWVHDMYPLNNTNPKTNKNEKDISSDPDDQHDLPF